MLNKLFCLLGWHDWEYLARENYTRLFRRCKHTDCKARQELKRYDAFGQLEYWG